MKMQGEHIFIKRFTKYTRYNVEGIKIYVILRSSMNNEEIEIKDIISVLASTVKNDKIGCFSKRLIYQYYKQIE